MSCHASADREGAITEDSCRTKNNSFPADSQRLARANQCLTDTRKATMATWDRIREELAGGSVKQRLAGLEALLVRAALLTSASYCRNFEMFRAMLFLSSGSRERHVLSCQGSRAYTNTTPCRDSPRIADRALSALVSSSLWSSSTSARNCCRTRTSRYAHGHGGTAMVKRGASEVLTERAASTPLCLPPCRSRNRLYKLFRCL